MIIVLYIKKADMTCRCRICEPQVAEQHNLVNGRVSRCKEKSNSKENIGLTVISPRRVRGRSDIRCSRARWKEARRGCTMSKTVTRLINGATFSSKNVGGGTAEQHFYDSNYLLLNKGCSPYQERAHLNRVKYNLLLCHFQTTYQIVVTSIYDSNVYLANCTSASDC